VFAYARLFCQRRAKSAHDADLLPGPFNGAREQDGVALKVSERSGLAQYPSVSSIFSCNIYRLSNIRGEKYSQSIMNRRPCEPDGVEDWVVCPKRRDKPQH
jgi:hypothetical protein